MTTLQDLVKAVMDGKEEAALSNTGKVMREGVQVGQVLEALTAGMRDIGEQFARMEIFLPEMLSVRLRLTQCGQDHR